MLKFVHKSEPIRAPLFRRRATHVRIPATPRWRRDDGFTLIEVLVVLGIIALLSAIVVPQVTRYMGHARTEAARIQLAAIASALELYALDNGGYPTAQQGLRALVAAPPGAARWKGPYLKRSDGLMDPWGRPYSYKIPGRQSTFEIFTLGRDNLVGGTAEDQDIVSW